MPEIKDYQKVEEGMLWGYVRTDAVGSKVEFPIMSVEEWEELSEEESEKAASDAMHESGVMEWGY